MTPREAEAGAWRLAPQPAWAELMVSALLFLYPVVMLPVREGVNYCFALLVALAFWFLFTEKTPVRSLTRNEIAYVAAMASPVAVTALSEIVHWHFRSPPFDGASRFLLGIPVYLMLRSNRLQTFAIWQYGPPLGAITAALIVLPQLPLAEGARASTPYMDAIRFGDLALALGILSAASINRADSRWGAALKVLGAAAALFASVESGTRGGWIALPAVTLVWWFLRGRGKLSWRLSAALTVSLMVLAVASFFFIGKIHDRAVDLYMDVVRLFNDDFDTSLGLRLQIWRVAIGLFAENPVFGLGPDQFKDIVFHMRDLGLLTPDGAGAGHSEVHSEILLHTVSLGIFGLASILSVYLVPLFLFVLAARGKPGFRSEVQSAGLAGACFVTGFLVFGLTIEIFNLKLIATFYSLTVAVLLAAVAPKQAAA